MGHVEGLLSSHLPLVFMDGWRKWRLVGGVTSHMFNAVNDLVLPVVKQVAAARGPVALPPAPDGWTLEPAEDDAAISLPASVGDGHHTTIGRLCELTPKIWLTCYVHCSTLTTAGIAVAAAAARGGFPLCGVTAVIFATWVTLYLAAGVLENLVRRHIYLRLLENGLLL